jgi:hypothetical protein
LLRLLVTANVVLSALILVILIMEAVSSIFFLRSFFGC